MSTRIEWADEVWNPLIGCSRVSAGCDNCYAISQVHRNLHPTHRGLTKLRPKDAMCPGTDWTGGVRTVPEALERPLKWKRPRRVFVNSLSDLFHHAVPFEFIAAVFGVMAATPKHTYLVLTKRPERARDFFAWYEGSSGAGATSAAALYEAADYVCGGEQDRIAWGEIIESDPSWPLSNVHLGASIEDQATADERLPILLDLPAALHWASYEPALGPVRLDWALWREHLEGRPALRWLVIGGESGPKARPFHLDWAEDLLAFCEGAGCPVFVKQLGASAWLEVPATGAPDDDGDRRRLVLTDRKGGDWNEWPEGLRVREVP